MNQIDLINAVKLLKESRTALVNSYSEKNSERYHYSFQYYKYKETLNTIIAVLLNNKWIDSQINLTQDRFKAQEISINCFKYVITVFIKHLTKESYQEILTETAYFNNKLKIKALEKLLLIKENMDIKTKDLLFDYHRDKMLFEQEIELQEKTFK